MAMESLYSMISKLFMLLSFPDPDLQKIGTVVARQTLRASPAVTTYAQKYPLVREFFCPFSRAVQISVTIIDECQCLKTVLDIALCVSVGAMNIATTSIFQVHIFIYSILMV